MVGFIRLGPAEGMSAMTAGRCRVSQLPAVQRRYIPGWEEVIGAA
jgi:hypothetical protein